MVMDAMKHGSKEYLLYAPYDKVLRAATDTMFYPNEHMFIVACPQARVSGDTGGGVNIPDFVRTLRVPEGPEEMSEIPIDCWELKRLPLKEDTDWRSWDASDSSDHMMKHAALTQQHKAVCAVLEANSTLKSYSTSLIIGIRFSHFVWEREQIQQAREHQARAALLDENDVFNAYVNTVHKVVDGQKVCLPNVIYFNELAFTDGENGKLVLTDAFKHAIYYPLAKVKENYGYQVKSQVSWFDVASEDIETVCYAC